MVAVAVAVAPAEPESVESIAMDMALEAAVAGVVVVDVARIAPLVIHAPAGENETAWAA